MSYEPRVERTPAMSRGERTKLVVMVAVFGLAAGLLTSLKTPGGGTAPEGIEVSPGPRAAIDPGMTPRTGQDAVKALATLQRHEQEQAARTGGQPAPVTTFVYDPTIVAQVQDGALDVVEEPAFYQLVARLHFMSDEELERAPELHGGFTFEQLKSPEGRDAARGRFIHLKGELLIPLFQRVLERYPNETGTDLAWVWQGVLRSSDYRGYFVTVTDKDLDPDPGEPIELVAAFLKAYRFETAEGIKTMPHVIAKRVRRLPPLVQRDAMHDPLLFGVAGAFLFVVLAVWLYARGSRTGAERFERWRHGRLHAPRKKLELAAATAGPSAEPTAPPSGETAPSAPADEALDAAAPSGETGSSAPADEALDAAATVVAAPADPASAGAGGSEGAAAPASSAHAPADPPAEASPESATASESPPGPSDASPAP